jgi:hypothetical protein
MRRLLVLISAAALISANAASAASAPNFSGSSTAPYPHVLSVTFTEIGVGSQPVSYTLEAAAKWQVLWCDGVRSIELTYRSWQTDPLSPIVPERGRASGELGSGGPYLPAATPGCPPPVPDEDGTIPPAQPIGIGFLGWFDITVTSSTGRVLELPDLLPATTSG